MNKCTLEDVELSEKRVFIRVDFNVPMNEQGKIREDTRIRGALPTIRYAVEQGARVLLASHMGRPKGKMVQALSLRPVADRLSELLGVSVDLAPDCIGPKVKSMVDDLAPGKILLLENVRFHAGETANDPEMAKAFAELADVVVNDAFGTAHRAHASYVGIVQAGVPAVAGKLMASEIDFFNKAGPINMRLHQMELLPGIGKKHTTMILEERDIEPFKSFEDIKNRVKLVPDPKKTIMRRIYVELNNEDKHRLFS